MKISSIAALLLPVVALGQLSDGPLRQPLEIASNGPELRFDLAMKEGTHDTVAAPVLNTRLLGGSLPGPTIRVRKGQWLYINFTNQLQQQQGVNTRENDYAYPDSTNLHFHGGHVSGERPGDDTTIIIDAGESFNYEVFFPDFHVGGTHWLHPHRHGSGTLQVGGGAATAFIVEDESGDVPPEVESTEEVVLVAQLFNKEGMDFFTDRSGDSLFQMEVDVQVGNEFLLVNGQYRPKLTITAGEWQRWRVVFAGWDRSPLDLRLLSNGVCETNLLAKDGIYINDYPRPIDFYPIATAGRADIMVRCSQAGTFVAESYLGELFTVESVNPAGGAGAIDVSTPPTTGHSFPQPTYLNDLVDREPTPRCSCETYLANDQLNGLSYDPNVFLHTIAQGSLVERTLEGIAVHPYHQHVYPFQLVEFFGISGSDADYHKVGDYHDTIMVRSSNTAVIRYEANNFLGRMAVHCHRLTHSDEGMLTFEDVVDPARGGVCDCSPKFTGGGFTRNPASSPTVPTRPPVSAPSAPTDGSASPTGLASEAPSGAPSGAPVRSPTRTPTEAPVQDSEAPVAAPTDRPTLRPTRTPTEAPVQDSEAPVAAPTVVPVEVRTPGPTQRATQPPTEAPVQDSEAPVAAPAASPTRNPTSPTKRPRKTQKPKKKSRKPKKKNRKPKKKNRKPRRLRN